MGTKQCSRRAFLGTAGLGLGAAAAVAAGGRLAWAEPATSPPPQGSTAGATPGARPALGRPGLVVRLHHADAMESMNKPRADVVGSMVDRGLLELTGKSDLAAAWGQVVTPADVVEIKINTLGKRYNSTNAETVEAIIRGLKSAGVKPEHIFIYDMYGSHMSSTREKLFRPDGKLVGYGDQWGYEKETTVHGAGKSQFAKVLGRVTAVINVPVMKDHSLSGITGALKNMTHGHVHNPGSFHRNGCMPGIPQIYAHPKIRDKVRLTIMDGLRLLYNGGPQDSPQHRVIHNTIYVTTDPVAVDTLLYEKIQEFRTKAKLRPIKLPKQLVVAEELGLGIHERSKIEVRDIELKAG